MKSVISTAVICIILFVSCKKEFKSNGSQPGVVSNAISSAPPAVVVDRYNGPGNKSDMVRAMTKDGDGNIYITGPSDDKRSTDYATIKYNAAGERQWIARYNGPGNGEDWPYAIAVDSHGDVLVTGRSMGKSSYLDYATVKYDGVTGQQIWVNRYNGSQNLNDVAKSIVVDANNDVIITGYTNGPQSLSGFAIVTIKYDGTSGSEKWVSSPYDALPDTNGNNEEGNNVTVDGSGNVFITGKSGANCITLKYNGSNGSSLWSSPSLISGGNGTRVKVDASGNVIVAGWGSTIAKLNSVDGSLLAQGNPTVHDCAYYDMEIDGAGNVYVTGWDTPGTTKDDFVTVKFDNNLQQVWDSYYDGPMHGIDLVHGLALDQAGNVYVSGYVEVYYSSKRTGSAYGTIKYDNNGNEIWVALYDAPEAGNNSFGVEVNADGTVFVAGQSAQKTYYDFLLIKYQQ